MTERQKNVGVDEEGGTAATLSHEQAEPEAPPFRLPALPFQDVLARFGVLIAFGVTFATFALLRPETFFTGGNLLDILTQSSPLAVISFGLTVVLIMQGFDLSFGSTVGLCSGITIVLISAYGVSWPPRGDGGARNRGRGRRRERDPVRLHRRCVVRDELAPPVRAGQAPPARSAVKGSAAGDLDDPACHVVRVPGERKASG
jgi:hypothetical protein